MSNAGSKRQEQKDKLLYFPKSSKETEELGRIFANDLSQNSILCFFGDLGAGKTTFIKGIAKGFGISPEEVSSPTFQLLHIYKGRLPLFHFDLYRLHTCEEFLSLGFDEFFYKGGVSLIEWSERIEEIIPKDACLITISHEGESARTIHIEWQKLSGKK